MENLSDREINFAVVAITVLIGLLIAFCISYVLIFRRKRKQHKREKQEFEQQLLKSQIEVQEHTFQQIGKELHDNVGQLLSTSKMLLGLAERYLEHPPDTLLTANAILAQAINELRSLSKSLDKEWLEQFSFIDNLKTEVTRINAANTVRATFAYTSQMELKADEQIILFRIVQEAIQNAIKHALPTHISITTWRKDSTFLLSIVDDGCGFNAVNHADGLGIANMKHRTALLHGKINWESNPGAGTAVNISLPIKP